MFSSENRFSVPERLKLLSLFSAKRISAASASSFPKKFSAGKSESFSAETDSPE